MAEGILVVGPSGSGKSTSLENLDPGSTFIINVKNKPLPFKGWKNNYKALSKDNPTGNYVGTDDPGTIIATMKHINDKLPKITTLVIEDFQYMAANEFMNRATETGLN